MVIMQVSVHSAATVGVQGVPVEVEVDVSNGIPHFLIVGLGDTAVQESKERVRAALRNSGFEPPTTRITVNLAPGNLRKAGSGFDLATALGILAASEALAGIDFRPFLVLGELALDGALRRVAGVLPIAVDARRRGKKLILPASNAAEAALVDDLQVLGFTSLAEVVAYLRDPDSCGPPPLTRGADCADLEAPDMGDVKGQTASRRAIEIAAAGHHNFVFLGPPGTGKSMLARRIPGILPPLTQAEALEVTSIYSVSGLLHPDRPLITRPPFRSPHHSISSAGLIGGSSTPRPGEVSLAHRGVLFLDELGEFSRATLEVLRQPLEDRRVVISRARGTVSFPADFALAAAMNPCPCGFDGDNLRICNCPRERINRYWSRLSGPLLDRIDLHIEVGRLSAEQILAEPKGESSAAVRSRVLAARERQARRFEGKGIVCNGQMQSRDLRSHCRLDGKGETLIRGAIGKMGLSARSYDRLLKVARTVADLDSRDAIAADDIREAIQYRILDQKLRG
jgi:magnesium chelatase family protein